MDTDQDITHNDRQPEDLFYHGVISKIFWRYESGIVRSDSGKEISFSFQFVTLLGVPRQDMRFLHEGMSVGFDVGWTSKGLRVMVIKIYDPSQGQSSPKQDEPAQELPDHHGQDGEGG